MEATSAGVTLSSDLVTRMSVVGSAEDLASGVFTVVAVTEAMGVPAAVVTGFLTSSLGLLSSLACSMCDLSP